jgi:5-methylcytosine-specific restriction endonuclease McrA
MRENPIAEWFGLHNPSWVDKYKHRTCRYGRRKRKLMESTESTKVSIRHKEVGFTRSLLLKLGARCEACGSQSKLLVHHVNHVRSCNEPENLKILCTQCHRLLHTMEKSIQTETALQGENSRR